MKDKFLSKAYGGVTVARHRLYGLGLPRQWKVITSTLLLLFTLAIGNVWAADPTVSFEYTSSTLSNYHKTYTTEGITISSSISSVSQNGTHYYAAGISSAMDASASSLSNCLDITTTGVTIDSVAFLISRNSSSKAVSPVLVGYDVNAFTTLKPSTAPVYIVQQSCSSSNTSYADAVWMKFDTHNDGLKKVRLVKQFKKVNCTIGTNTYVSGTTYFDGAQTFRLWGVKVWLHPAAKTDPTITFNNGAYTVGGALDLSTLFVSNSDGAVTYTVKTDGGTNASIVGTSFSASAAGTAVVTASQAATSAFNAATKDANIVVSVPSTPTHSISYTNLKGSDVSAYPTTYYEGTGIASFAALADVADFHFNGWSPSSIPTTAKADPFEVSATWVDAYNVTFSYGAGGGTVPASFQKWQGAKFNLPGQGSMTAPSGKVFDGWKANGTGDKLAANAEYTMGDDAVQFVAQWKNTPTVLFHYQSDISSAPSLNTVLPATGGSLTTRSYKTNSPGSFNAQNPGSYATGTPDDMKVKSGKKALKHNNNDVYLKLALTSGKLQTGDTIIICGYGTIDMYKRITLGTGFNDKIVSLTMSGTSSSNYGVNTTVCVIPQVDSKDVEYDSLCLARNSNGYIAAIKIIRPAEKEVKSTVNTLTDVKVNGTSIAAANLTTLVSTHSLALDDAEATAPKITFNKHTVITYVDDTQKVTDTPIEETAADNGAGKWAASTTIDAVTYTVTLNIATGYHVTYKANGGDGTMTDANLYAAGDEVTVLDNAFTAPAANKKFNGWTSSPAVTISGEGKFEMPTSDVELSAVWTEFFTITYKDGDETLDTEDVFVGGTPAGLSPAPTKPLYVFGGWVNDVEEDVDITAITTTTTVYVKWNKVYVPQGANYVFENTATVGTAPNAITVTKDNNKNSIAANSRIDNMWLSAMDVKLEDGAYAGSGDDFKGWKINTSGATIRFFVENDSRVTVTVGNLTSGLNITYTAKNATEEATTALTAKAANPYDVKGGTLVTLTTGGGSTVTLKGIAVSAIPALDDDATLSDLKVGGVTVAGFSANTHTYYYELPYGTAVGDIPAISATANSAKAKQVAIEQAVWTGDPYNCYRAQANVQAEDESWGYYDVQFSFAPKYGVELIKATHDGTASGATITGYIGGQKDKDTYANGKLGEIGKYFGIKLADGNFQAGDLVEVKVSMFEGGNTATMFTDKGETPLSSGAFDVNNKVYRFTLTAETEWIYIYRKDGTCNPRVQSIAVYRQMAPFIEEFKIGEAVGTINKSAKTIAVEVPYGTDVTSLTPDVKYWANGGGSIDKTGAQNFSSPVDYTVSSAYAEDATGDYAPVTYTVTVNVAAHYEAKIGETRYSTVTAAFDAVDNGETIELMDNCSYADTWVIDGKNVTLDLHGFNLTYTSNQGAADVKNGKLTIKDVTATVAPVVDMTANPLNEAAVTYTSGKFDCGAGVGIYSLAGGEVVVESGRLEAQECVVLVLDNGKVTVNNGVLVAKDNGVLMGNGTAGRGGYTITVNDGVLIGKIQSAGYASMVIYHPNVGTLNISGGTLISTNGPAVVVRAGESHIDGGTIVAQGSGTGKCGDATLVLPAVGVAYDFKSAYPGGNINAEITGGDVTGAAGAVTAIYAATEPTPAEEAAVNISGGAFSSVVAEVLCAEGYIPVTTPNTQGKYEVIAAGIIRGAAVQDANDVYYYTLDNGVTIYSSQSDGRLNTSNHISNSSSDVTNCGGDNVGHNVNQSKFVIKFPVNVKEFTLYGANSTERTISMIYVNAEGSKTIKISEVGTELTGTYTNTKDGKCQTLTAAFNDANIISANYYVLVTLSGTANIYRVLYTEAECTTPTVTVADQTAKDGVAVNLIAEASALGATYQWYTCEDELGTNPVIMPGKTAKTLSVTKSGADDQFYKVVVGCNCSAETAAAVAKVSLYTAVTTLVDVTENTIWDWTVVTKDIDGQDITSDGKKVNGANGILANYIQGTNMDKIESNNGAYAIRSNSNKYYQGASLHMHTTKAGMLKIHARSDGSAMKLIVAGIDMGSMTSTFKDYVVYIPAGDVVIYNVPETDGKPMRIDHMTFTVKESPDYTRDQMLGAGVYGTICVPYNVPAGGIHGITVYELMGRESQYGKLAFDEIIEMEAGVPYVFQAHGDELALFYGETSKADPVDKGNGMYGTFADQILTDLTDVYYFAQKALWGCADLTSLSVPANRAYVKLSEVGSADPNPAPGRRRISMAVNGEQIATGIENTGFESEAPRKVLINGELFIIRGEKMYDAKGQLVK